MSLLRKGEGNRERVYPHPDEWAAERWLLLETREHAMQNHLSDDSFAPGFPENFIGAPFALIFQSPRAFAAISASASATNRALNLGENALTRPTSRQTNPQTSLSRENLNLSTAQCGHAALLKPRGAGTPRRTASDNAG
jgi:hypothetical protein